MGFIQNPDQSYSSGDVINTIRETAKNCYDIIELKKLAFHEIKLPKRKYMATKRSFYVKQITTQLHKSLPNSKESTSQWIRRRSTEILGLRANNLKDEYRVVISSDGSKVAVLRKSNKSINEITIFCVEDIENYGKSQWNLKNPFIIGITNDAKRIICCNYSLKSVSKHKDDIKIDIIGVDFDPCDGFYLENSNSVIIISNWGLVSKHKLENKQIESILIFNDKSSKVVSAQLNDHFIWLDTLSNHNNTHKFIAFDINSLDIYTTIDTDCFSIHKFSIISHNNKSVIIVKNNPINGKLRKAIDILTNDKHRERVYDLYEEIFDIKCFSLNDQNIKLVADSTYVQPLNPCLHSESLIILVTRDSANICIEYGSRNYWNKTIVSNHKINDISDINSIKIVRLVKDKNEFNLTLFVYKSESSLINVKLISQ